MKKNHKIFIKIFVIFILCIGINSNELWTSSLVNLDVEAQMNTSNELTHIEDTGIELLTREVEKQLENDICKVDFCIILGLLKCDILLPKESINPKKKKKKHKRKRRKWKNEDLIKFILSMMDIVNNIIKIVYKLCNI